MTPPGPRGALIKAGRSLALRFALSEVDPVRICSEARLPPEAFEQHFNSIAEYLTVLQKLFMQELRDRIFKAITGMKPGIPRIKLAIEVYLEGCLAERFLRNWLIESRADPAVADALRRNSQPYALVIGSELRSLGWPAPSQAAGRVVVAMVNEIALVEHRMGQAVPDLRETLWDFLERAGPRGAKG